MLSEFRTRLVAGAAEAVLLDAVLEVAAAHRLLKVGGRQRTDSTHVLAATRAINQIECAHETLRHALEVLALAAPTWLLTHALPHWATAYGRRAFDERLPRSAAKRAQWAQQIGEDGHHLLSALDAAATPDWLRQLPATVMLRRVWIQQFHLCDDHVQWRSEREGVPPPARFISSPYDADAHYACKRSTTWIGYKVHLSETYDEGLPRTLTEVQTTAGPVADGDVTTPIHHALRDKGLLPAQPSSTPATSLPVSWWRRSATSESTWSGLPAPTSVDNRKRARASPWTLSRSTGMRSGSPVRWASKAQAEARRWTTVARRSSR